MKRGKNYIVCIYITMFLFDFMNMKTAARNTKRKLNCKIN